MAWILCSSGSPKSSWLFWGMDDVTVNSRQEINSIDFMVVPRFLRFRGQSIVLAGGLAGEARAIRAQYEARSEPAIYASLFGASTIATVGRNQACTPAPYLGYDSRSAFLLLSGV